MTSDNMPPNAVLRELLKIKMGSLLEWQKPEIEDTVGPFEPEVFDHFEKQIAKVQKVCLDRLVSFSSIEIDILSNAEIPSDIAEKKEWAEFEGRQISKLQRRKPPWYAGGFGHDDFAADFEYWSQMPQFSYREVLLLSLGVEPKHFSDGDIDDIKKSIDQDRDLWSPLHFMIARQEQISRRFNNSFNSTIAANEFFLWVDQIDFKIHSNFYSRYSFKNELRHGVVSTSKAAKLDDRLKGTFQKLIITMAICGYTYRPGAARSDVYKDIQSDAARLGIDITTETIRNHLRGAEYHISDDWEPSDR